MFGKESVTMAGQVAVMGTALVGTGSSTLLLNLCVSPYVFRMTEVWDCSFLTAMACREADVSRMSTEMLHWVRCGINLKPRSLNDCLCLS